MKETEWVELVAGCIRADMGTSDQALKIKTQLKIPYGYEIRA